MWSGGLTGVSALTLGDSSPLFLGTTGPLQFLLAKGAGGGLAHHRPHSAS